VVQNSTAYRVVYSETDGLPGLIVDRYGPLLSIQVLSIGMEQILPLMTELLLDFFQPQGIVARNDSGVRALEGLPLEKRWIHGSGSGRVEVMEGERRYTVDVWEGQKTGAYLDQRENRQWARSYARGRVLDAFSYEGGFTLHMASEAEEVLAIEDSDAAVQHLKEHLTLNRITNVRVERGNAFDRLRSLDRSGEKFDLIILDPPAFAKSKGQIRDGCRGYREINLRALRLLKSEGTLITCSCSYNVTEEIFLDVLRDASRDAQRPVRFLESRTQSRDHPILMTHPESKYLKCVLLEAE